VLKAKTFTGGHHQTPSKQKTMSKKLSVEQHKALGNYKPSRHDKPAAEPPTSNVMQGRPKRPSYLSDEAKREWQRLTSLLSERGSLTPADASALTLHCEVWSRWLDCQRQLRKDGVVITVKFFSKAGEEVTALKQHPCLRVAQQCEASLRQSLHSFGLTPAARERITPAAEPPPAPQPYTGMTAADIMNQGKKS
jgi:P27 family predicted phage terminase small subunit